MVAELARRRPADRTPAAAPGQFPDQPSEFVADEIAAALTLTGPAAGTCLDLAMDLAIRLPGTAAALRAGIIDYLRARIIAEATRILSDQDARQAEDRILPGAGQQTSGQLRAALARTILAIDPAAAQRRREQAQKDPRIRRWREDAGTAALAGYGLPPADVLEADQHLTERALHLRDAGQPGTLDELRARAYLDALLGRHPAAHPVRRTRRTRAGRRTRRTRRTRRPGRTRPGARRSPPAPAVRTRGPAVHGAAPSGPSTDARRRTSTGPALPGAVHAAHGRRTAVRLRRPCPRRRPLVRAPRRPPVPAPSAGSRSGARAAPARGRPPSAGGWPPASTSRCPWPPCSGCPAVPATSAGSGPSTPPWPATSPPAPPPIPAPAGA